MARLTGVLITISSWALPSVPTHDLRKHTARTIAHFLYDQLDIARVDVAYDEEPAKQLVLEPMFDGTPSELDRANWLAVQSRIVESIVKRILNSYVQADARHRAPLLTLPTADQLRRAALR